MYSRSEATALIKHGRVAVGGQVVFNGAVKCDPLETGITVDGVTIEYKYFTYIMMNKPSGYVSSTVDNRDKTVMELLDAKYAKLGLFPAGRLDKDAEGLLLLTNDGDFAHRILSPGKKIYKRYFVQFDGILTDADVCLFTEGVRLGDGYLCLPAVLEPVSGGAFVMVCEGKYHQVKRMMAAAGKHVTYLKRVAVGGLELHTDLCPGESREIGDLIMRVFDEVPAPGGTGAG